MCLYCGIDTPVIFSVISTFGRMNATDSLPVPIANSPMANSPMANSPFGQFSPAFRRLSEPVDITWMSSPQQAQPLSPVAPIVPAGASVGTCATSALFAETVEQD